MSDNKHIGETICKFYTYPPIDYPFVLRNVRQKELKNTHEIVDIGVYELLKEPHYYSDKTLKKFEDCKTSGWKTVPDYPDIFAEHSIEKDIDNVELSKELLLKYYDPENISHLPVIQGYYNDPFSFVDYAKWFKKEFGVPEKIGIGTVCKQSKKKIMLQTLSFSRKMFPNAWIHAFGLSIRYIKEVSGSIDSFDSTAWTFPRTPNRPSCKNKEQRIQYFLEYLELLDQKLSIDERITYLEEFF